MTWIVRWVGRWLVYRVVRWGGPLLLTWVLNRYSRSNNRSVTRRAARPKAR